MNQSEAKELLLNKINHAISEHGRPNTFSAMELCSEYGYPSIAWAYRLGRQQALAGRLIDYKRGKFIAHY